MKYMKHMVLAGMVLAGMHLLSSVGWSAYHHQGEADAPKFVSVYPNKAGTKLDQCNLCHSGGSYVSGGKTVAMGSCQWCHYKYGYDEKGDIAATLNSYGNQYKANGRDESALKAIENLDADGDTYTNLQEIDAVRYPGDANDDPSKTMPPYRVFTREQLAAMPQHTQFLLMNTSKSGDYYAEYSGVPLQELLGRAGITAAATGITVYAPDGFSTYHPLEPDPNPNLYHVNGVYPATIYYYDVEADTAKTSYGWCDYSAPSTNGRSNGDAITGLKNILAIRRDGAYLTAGVLTNANKLDGEGPFRVVPPQKTPGPPDQASSATNQAVKWPYKASWDHNAGFSSRSATIIKVNPLPPGTTDIDVMEAGWNYIDDAKIVVYGAIATDNFATPQAAMGTGEIAIDSITPGTKLSAIKVMADDDSTLNQTGKPEAHQFRDGIVEFKVTDVTPGGTVLVQLLFPNAIPAGSTVYKITKAGFTPFPDAAISGRTVTLSVTDGGFGDADGIVNGIIQDPVGVASPGTGGSTSCFIATAAYGSYLDPHVQVLRDFRERWLVTNGPGRAFVDLYYRYSPPVASVIEKHGILKLVARIILTPVVYGIKYIFTVMALLGFLIILLFVWMIRRRQQPV